MLNALKADLAAISSRCGISGSKAIEQDESSSGTRVNGGGIVDVLEFDINETLKLRDISIQLSGGRSIYGSSCRSSAYRASTGSITWASTWISSAGIRH